MSNGRVEFGRLLLEMAGCFETESRLEADNTAKSLRSFAPTYVPNTAQPSRYDRQILSLAETTTHPCARAVAAAFPWLNWLKSGILDAQIPDQISDMFAVAPFLGPDDILGCNHYRAGLYFQRPHTYYQLHRHAAHESYVIIAGHALATKGSRVTETRPNDVLHHPTMTPHAMETWDSPLLALWRWNGNIDPGSYEFLPDPKGFPLS